MIIRFGCQNHLSIRSNQSIVLTASSLRDREDGLITSKYLPQLRVLPAAVMYGPNASGKSNFIDAFDLMRDHVLKSHSMGKPGGKVPRKPYALDRDGDNSNSRFELDFITSDVRYNYGYETDGKVFVEEWLYSFPAGRKQRLFERNGQSFSFGRSLKGQNKIIEGLTRPNSLFVSSAAQNDHEELSKIYKFFEDISFDGNPFEEFEHEMIDARIISFLEKIGTGIVDFKLKEMTVTAEAKALTEGLNDLFQRVFSSSDALVLPVQNEKTRVQMGHRTDSDEIVYFDIENESVGTRNLVKHLQRIFRALEHGSVVIIDEIDASLHTQAVELLVALFSSPITNKSGAQLIGTVHDTNILRSKFLRRDQIWFAEKTSGGETIIFSLSDIQTKRGDNLERAYLEGRYGAVPLNSLSSDVISELAHDA